jgi:aspartyl-tRNA(Asn)/glutamyl-tRNA(Gln) amidotransferase subunit A
MYLSDIYTVSVNLAGLPGLSIPWSTDKNGLPIGVQLIGRHFDEAKLLRVGRTVESNRHDGKDGFPG